ncbi:MAG: imidazole glycerol phosphate synthase subunit HisH [Sphingomonadaceae bacterium]|nr:imidazole glycerol phosphate synthase subunit HisH [Sphingomonadaceae bacterium]NBU78420.1 imidazole glycerol phosphate synthase subunit HisH [Sphingomonadaceae bacterium]NCA02481.1 imidazole glycerol phosphate synthase subunit HisH [Sphingomonadaceae bacterium]
MSLALIDYGAGNLQSVRNALKAAGAEDVVVTADPDAVRHADRIVLPGVGAFAHCMIALTAIDGMVDALNDRVIAQGHPFLGICVGMQLMAEAGEEHGRHQGLAWISGTVRRIEPTNPALKVPHMGWNDVVPTRPHPLLQAGEAYFLHSYAFEGTDVLAQTDHGGPIVAAIGRDNFAGVQFHPEKSQRYGLALLSRFLEWQP